MGRVGDGGLQMGRREGSGCGVRGRRVWLLALVVLMASCSGSAAEVEIAAGPSDGTPDPSEVTTAPADAPSATSAPEPPTATPAEYQGALTALDDRLSGARDELRRHRAPAGLPEAISALRAQVDGGRGALAAVVPPATVTAAHEELDTALLDLSFELTSLESAAAAQEVCAGDSAIRRLGDSDAAAAVREASARLAESDPLEEYTVGAFVPAPDKQRNRRGRNGDLRRGRRGGAGRLEITGSPDYDSLLKLRVKKRGIRNVYVRRNASVTVESLPDGTYEIYLAQGRDWSDADNRFTRECSFSVFDDKLTFETTSTQYTIYQLELLESFFGNATSTTLDPDDFPN